MTMLTFGPRPEPTWNQEVTRSHAGEDGPCWKVETTREMFIDEQSHLYEMESWYVWELVDFTDYPDCDEE